MTDSYVMMINWVSFKGPMITCIIYKSYQDNWLLRYDDYCASFKGPLCCSIKWVSVTVDSFDMMIFVSILMLSKDQICNQYCVSFKGPTAPCIIRDSEITDSYDMIIVVLDLRDLPFIVL